MGTVSLRYPSRISYRSIGNVCNGWGPSPSGRSVGASDLDYVASIVGHLRDADVLTDLEAITGPNDQRIPSK